MSSSQQQADRRTYKEDYFLRDYSNQPSFYSQQQKQLEEAQRKASSLQKELGDTKDRLRDITVKL